MSGEASFPRCSETKDYLSLRRSTDGRRRRNVFSVVEVFEFSGSGQLSISAALSRPRPARPGKTPS